ncbi:hypothetical protein [Flavobacterium sp. KJJ]|uniref:hypothetical protein n=1 Tax=Flavobacterium sp. KJJ TaxID=1270193 RepID=UPI0004936506|nr:hypothetical protein [Flavobacterium sp. KJJ]
MLKKSILLTIILVLFNNINLMAQSLNPTSSIGNPGTADTFKAGYTFAYASSGTPWNGSLISYGGFTTNDYDTQISSDYGPSGGNHISYRTKNGDTNTWNSWNELAIRGINNFTGNQTINGNVGIGITAPEAKLHIYGNNGETTNIILAADYPDRYRWRFKTMDRGNAIDLDFTVSNHIDNQEQVLILSASNSGRPEFQLYNNAIVANDGNVGIGTATPDSKLAVNGTIHSKEVKVDMIGWPDYVFKKEYTLPTLEEVEKHITEKGHLENIPSQEEVLKNGINLGEMNAKLLQKIEELTLYTIQQQKNTEKLTKIIEELAARLQVLETK